MSPTPDPDSANEAYEGLPTEWTRHPRFPARAVLIESHHYFRRLGAWLLVQLEKVGSEVSGTARRRRIIGKLGQSFEDLLWGLTSHQRYEEQRLFPFLEACYLSLSFDRFEAAHRQLEGLAAGPREAFGSASQARSDEQVEAVRQQASQALRGYCAVLADHFDAEEHRVIPLVLELSAEDYAALRASKASCALPQ